MDIYELTKAANILFNCRLNNSGLTSLPSQCIPLNIEEAYSIQDELKKLYLTLKDNYIIGKKVGCTNKYAQEQVNVKEPFYGNLFSKYYAFTGCKLLSKNFYKPFIEPEFSFRINQDINISKAPFKFEQILEYIDSIIPSIEIVDFRFNKKLKDIGINNLISTNGASEYWIKGKEEFKLNFLDLTNHPVEVYINDEKKETGNSSNVLGNPIYSLLWLINKLCEKGEPLLKNHVVSTGTCTMALPLKIGDKVKASFASMGNVEFQYN